ncbi:MAG: hypothetical protein U5R14_13690 [Gemmatimonadota bacterium]|nr:hypothetical protein [Gemmatimonadota bacterium]
MHSSDRFEHLVDQTTGTQPWRRIVHAVNGITFASILTFWPYSEATAIVLLTGAVAALLLLDALRLRLRRLNACFFRVFNRLASPREADHIASSTWYMLGITLAVVLSPTWAAVSGILVLALADPTASYVGRRWGRRPFLGGSMEGSAVFFLVTLAVLLPRHPWAVALAVALPITVLERRAWPLDDNLAIPVACSVLLHWLEGQPF